MKYKFFLAPFPFADATGVKPRPALCLNEPTSRFGEVILAFVTSQIPPDPQPSDLFIDPTTPEGAPTSLKLPSMVRLHRLFAINESLLGRELGQLTPELELEVEAKLRQLFGL